MASIVDILDSIHPATDAVGVILSDQIWVIFDREIDEYSINNGNFFVEGPDTDTFIGPDVGLNLPEVSDSGSGDQLTSPGYKGLVTGTFSFEKIQNTASDVYSGFDTSGSGSLWRTKAIFTPTNPLQKLVKYTVYLSGDEDTDDGLSTGIRSRSIFDVVNGSNIGTGEVEFVGTYTGNATQDSFHVKITTAGEAGVAWFTWWRGSDPSLIFGPIRTEQIQNTILEDDISVNWGTGSFVVNDTFAVVVKKPVLFTGNTYWSFTTGTGSIQAIPTTTSTSIIGDTASTIVPTTLFAVNKITPKDKATNLPITTSRIIIEFNSEVDPDTVTADSVTVQGLPVNGDENLFSPVGIFKDITVSGTKIILDI
jgi:hypothetical protein